VKKKLFCIIKTPGDSFYHYIQAGAMHIDKDVSHTHYVHAQTGVCSVSYT